VCSLSSLNTGIGRRVGWYTPLIRRVLVRMIGFISTLVTHSLLITFKYRQNNAIADLHTFQLTAARALEFSFSTSRLLATDLNRETIASNHKVFQSHFYVFTGRRTQNSVTRQPTSLHVTSLIASSRGPASWTF
jgi:hypothetical protein